MTLSLRDMAGQLGIKVDWDPATRQATVGGQTFAQGQVPGTYYDAASQQHMVNDDTIFRSTFAPPSMAVENALQNYPAYTTPDFKPQQGQKQDLSWLYGMYKDYMAQPINRPDYTPTDMSQLNEWIQGYQQQYGQGPFSGEGFMDLLQQIQQLQPPEMRYQTPEQIQQLQQIWMQAMQPNLDAQQALMQSQYGQGLDAITRQRASQGLLGGPGTERMMGDLASQHSLQSGAMQQQAAMEALMQAFNYAGLGLQEQGQNFGQQLGVAQTALGGYGQGLGMQQGAEADAMQMLAQMLGMQEGQAQFGAGLDLSVEQMRQMAQQFGMQGLSGTQGMDMQQGQWAQDFGQTSLRDQYNMWAGTEGLNMQQAGLTGYLGGSPTLGRQQYDLARDLGIAGLTGQLYGEDTMQMQDMMARMTGQFRGEGTMDFNNMMANLSGINPYTGKQTWAAGNADRSYNLALGEMMGYFGIGADGKPRPTLARDRANAEQGLMQAGWDRETSSLILDGMRTTADQMGAEKNLDKKRELMEREIRGAEAYLQGMNATPEQSQVLLGMVRKYLEAEIPAPREPGALRQGWNSWWDMVLGPFRDVIGGYGDTHAPPPPEPWWMRQTPP